MMSVKRSSNKQHIQYNILRKFLTWFSGDQPKVE